MTDEFQNALAWFRSAPSDWIESGRKSMAAAAEWVWEVLQGDFNDDASTAQVAVGTVISMIPFVDQLCDVRDVVANCRKIDQEPDNKWNWICLALTLVGLIPGIGSLFKGCFKVAFASMRKAGAASGVTPRIALKADQAIHALNKFLERSDVVASLKALKWDNPYKILSTKLKEIAGKLNASTLMSAFNEAMKAIRSLLELVAKWGSSGVAGKAVDLLRRLDGIQRNAYSRLEEVVAPLSDSLLGLARRLDVDADKAHRVYLKTVNPHAYRKVMETEEIAAFEKAKPEWVDRTLQPANPHLPVAPTQWEGWPSTKSFKTFHTMEPKTLAPGTVIYRIVDPTSKDNSLCWMTKEEFSQLKSKAQWHRRFAVWAKWNGNGEFVTYTIPPGPGLNVWEGVTASQTIKGTDFALEGGARQLVVDPAHMDRSYIGSRQKTGWGYDELGTQNDLVGVPTLRNNWEE